LRAAIFISQSDAQISITYENQPDMKTYEKVN